MKLTEKKRLEIIENIETNKSNRFIARKVGVSPSTVANIINKYRILGTILDKPRSGRTRSTSVQEDRLICLLARRNPTYSCREIKTLNDSLRNKSISLRTINNRLCEKKLFSYASTRKPFLSKADKYRRLKFCKSFIQLSQGTINNIIFSDESNFQVFNRDTKLRIRRKPTEKYLSQHITPRVQYGGGSIGFWGCIHSTGIGLCKTYEGRVDRFEYKNILETCLIPSMETFTTSSEQLIFQQDNAPAHRSQLIEQYLNNKQIKTLKWPARSPDLNLIENIWSYVDRELIKKKITSKAKLKEEIEHIWKIIPNSLIESLYKSMKTRCNLIIKNKGGHIPY